MRTRIFQNNGTLYLEGNTKKIDPFSASITSYLTNEGEVILGENDFANFTINTKYDQPASKTTQLKQGILKLDGGSTNFSGTFLISTSERLEINRGTYLGGAGVIPGIGGGNLKFEGPGVVTMGGSQLTPEISGGDILNMMGFEGDGPVDTDKGFIMRTGTISMPGKSLRNKGYMNWQGGTIKGGTANEAGTLSNISRLDISAGAPRILAGVLYNGPVDASKRPVSIIQTSSLTMAAEDDGIESTIWNDATHRLRSGSSISGGAGSAYFNQKLLICEGKSSVSITCTFDNRATVQVVDDSTLGFTNIRNLTETGVFVGGTWEVEEGSKILLPGPIKTLIAKWTGPGANMVTNITGPSTVLRKTTDEFHSVRLEVDDGAALLLDEDTTTTIPEVELKDDGYLRGSGELAGDLLVGSGNVAPGDSPGILTITGDTTFTADSTYEWETNASNNADLLQINSGIATLAGTVRPMLIDGYYPSGQTTFTILNAPTIVGTFDQVDDTALPTGMTATLGYTGTSVTLTLDWTIELSSYDDWKTANFTDEEEADVLISGPGADPDKDGLTNLQEYTFGTLPKTPNAVPVNMSDATDEYVELTFPWSDGISDAFFQIELGDDLETFLPVQHAVVQSDSTDGVTQYTIRIDISDLGTPSFVRLRTLQIEL
jgi:hypothetical protein